MKGAKVRGEEGGNALVGHWSWRASEAKLCTKAFLSDLCRTNDTAKKGGDTLYESWDQKEDKQM